MGNSLSNQGLQVTKIKDPKAWQFQFATPYCQVLKNILTGEQVEQYTLILDPKLSLAKQFEIYEYRKKQNFNLVSVINIQKHGSQNMCSGIQVIKVRTERILYRLSDLENLSLNEGLYVLRESLYGFKIIMQFDCGLRVQPNMICITSKGKIKVWLNQHLQYNHAELINQLQKNSDQNYLMKIESMMVEQILKQVFQRLKGKKIPKNLMAKLQSQKMKTFTQTINLINNYCEEERVLLPDNLKISNIQIKQENVYNSNTVASNKINEQHSKIQYNRIEEISKPISATMSQKGRIMEQKTRQVVNLSQNSIPTHLQNITTHQNIIPPQNIVTQNIIIPPKLPQQNEIYLTNSPLRESIKQSKVIKTNFAQTPAKIITIDQSLDKRSNPKIKKSAIRPSFIEHVPQDYQQIVGFENQDTFKKTQSASTLETPARFINNNDSNFPNRLLKKQYKYTSSNLPNLTQYNNISPQNNNNNYQIFHYPQKTNASKINRPVVELQKNYYQHQNPQYFVSNNMYQNNNNQQIIDSSIKYIPPVNYNTKPNQFPFTRNYIKKQTSPTFNRIQSTGNIHQVKMDNNFIVENNPQNYYYNGQIVNRPFSNGPQNTESLMIRDGASLSQRQRRGYTSDYVQIVGNRE